MFARHLPIAWLVRLVVPLALLLLVAPWVGAQAGPQPVSACRRAAVHALPGERVPADARLRGDQPAHARRPAEWRRLYPCS